MPRALFALIAVVFLVGCFATTDSDVYFEGEEGIVTFGHLLPSPVYLSGCQTFEYEEKTGEIWRDRGSDIICVWEGIAQRIEPGSTLEIPFEARNAGIWRIKFPTGYGCQEAKPLSAENCRVIHNVRSNEFEVVEEAVQGACVITGCSGQICAAEHVVTTCEWLPYYACFREATCGPSNESPDGCGWELTPELEVCLMANGGPSLRGDLVGALWIGSIP